MIRRNVRAVLMAMVALLVALSAHAQGDEALAEALFQEGQRLMVAKKYDEACAKFSDSLRIDPSTGTLLNLASCREKQGKLATAWALYSKASNQARLAGHGDRQAYAQQKVAELEPKLSRLTINLDKSEDRTGVHVTLDGEPVSDAAIGFPFPVDAGKHVIVAKQPGRVDWQAEVTVGGNGAKESITVPLLAAGPEGAGAAPVAGAAAAAGTAGAAATTTTPADPKEVERLQKELEELREKRSDIGIGGPITLLGIGGGVAIVGVAIMYSAVTVTTVLDEDEVDGGLLAAGAVTLAVGAGLAVGGGLFLKSRLSQRKALDPAIQEREEKLEAMGVEVSGIGFNPMNGTFVVSGRF